jgi:hypothetical protein
VKSLDVKFGETITINGNLMELVAVGNLQVAEHQRVEIAQFQKLEDAPPSKTPQDYLVEVLIESGFNKAIQKDIIAAAIGRDTFRVVADLTNQEADQAEAAIISAVLDRQQLEEDHDN